MTLEYVCCVKYFTRASKYVESLMQEPFEGISFNFALFFIHCCVFFMMMMMMMLLPSFRVYSSLYLPFDEVALAHASLNNMPAPEPLFVFIKISYKIFYNRFRVIRI